MGKRKFYDAWEWPVLTETLYHNLSTICWSQSLLPRPHPIDSSNINFTSFPLDHVGHRISEMQVDECDHMAIDVGLETSLGGFQPEP